MESYDEDEVLNHYVWMYYPMFLKEFEHRVWRAHFFSLKFGGNLTEVQRKYAGVDEPEIQQALRNGFEVFARQTRDRMLQEHAEEIIINRCSQCNCVARTPAAKQCLHCGHDWRESTEL